MGPVGDFLDCRIETKNQHWNYPVPQTSTFKMVVSVGWLQIITRKMGGWNHDSMAIHQVKRLLFTVPGKKSRIELLGTVEWKNYIIQLFRIIGEQKFTPCEGSGDQTDDKKTSSMKQETLGGAWTHEFFGHFTAFVGFMAPRIPWMPMNFPQIILWWLLPSYV